MLLEFLLSPFSKRSPRILGALDDKIELNRRMNRTLEELASVLFSHRFIVNPQNQKWLVGTLGDDFKLTMGQSPPGNTYNELGRGTPFYQGKSDFEFRYPKNRVYCTAPTRYAKKNDTLVSVRAPVGAINMASEKCAIGRGVAAIRHKSGSRSYTYYAMKSLKDRFYQFEADGTVFGSINKDDFLNIEYKHPPKELIFEFENVCFSLDQMIEVKEKESLGLIELRDTLLPRLMRGEIISQDSVALSCPWVHGVFQLILHAEEHLQNGEDFERPIATNKF